MRATLVLVFVAMAALAIASMVEAKTWEEDDMIIVEGRFARPVTQLAFACWRITHFSALLTESRSGILKVAF